MLYIHISIAAGIHRDPLSQRGIYVKCRKTLVRSGDILMKILHRARAIPSMSDDLVQSLLHRSFE